MNIAIPHDMKFGRIRPPKTSSKPTLEKYVSLAAAPPPASVHWATKVPSWGYMLNNVLGDCTLAAIGHIIQVLTSNSKPYNCPPDSYILKAYEAISGYTPSNPASDVGCSMLDTLEYWQSTGIGMNSHKITGFTAINPYAQNTPLVQWGIFNLGALYMGFNVPESAITQYQAGEPWTLTTTGTNIVAGHAVGIFGYDADWLYFNTWSHPKMMSWPFFWAYVEEAYTVFTKDWKPLLGFNQAEFEKDHKAA